MEKKNILITGISHGVGLHLIRFLLPMDKYIIYGVSRNKTPELEELLEKYPDALKWKSFDLENPHNIEQDLFEDFIDIKTTPLYAFVSNAAILYKELIARIDIEQMNRLMQINLISPIILTKFVLKNFLYHKTAGTIIHLSSICAHRGFDGLSIIGASKGGIEAFSRNTAMEYGRKGIRSNSVVIGILDVGMSFSVTDRQRDDIFSSSALKGYTDVNSVIHSINYLLSEQAQSITGQNIHVNAGIV